MSFMVPGAINETDWRDRSLATVARWCGVSLALHLVATQLPERFEFGAKLEPNNEPTMQELTVELTKANAPAEPTPSEIRAEPQPASEMPKASPLRSESAKSAVVAAEPREKADEATAAATAASDEAAGGAKTADTAPSEAGADGATAADIAASKAEPGASGPFADLEPSRPGERLMFDPFRANRAQSSGGIRLLIDFSRLRRHPLGVAASELLARVDPSALLGSTGLDPIRDTERLFIHAPSFRDWSGLVMMIQHRIATAGLRARLDQRIERATKNPDRGALFVVTPKPGLLIAAPETAAPSAEEMTTLVALPSSPPPSFVWAHFETPWRVFSATPLSIPRSLRWAEVLIGPDAGGGMVLRFEAEVEDERSASVEAVRLVAAISDGFDLLAGSEIGPERKSERAPNIEFQTRGPTIVGTWRFSAAQVAALAENMPSRPSEETPPPSTNP
jgi:hypothetical protein